MEGKKVLVIGEAMIDMYIHGTVNRISPEAPVPVVLFDKHSSNLGGSANICQNLANLGIDVTLMTPMGKDEHEPVLTKLCNNSNINLIPIYLNRPTIVKQRIMGGHQQIIRVDFENKKKLNLDEEDKAIKFIKETSTDFDTIILSDYSKGLFTKRVIETIFNHFHRSFIMADSKPDKIDLFKRANLIKCNFKEFAEYCELKKIQIENEDYSIERAFDKLKYDFAAFLLTRSEKGMSYLSEKKYEHIPTNAKTVFDVTGAGDSVTAAYITKYLENGIEELAMNFANQVAGIVVSKPGCVAITMQDLKEKKGSSKIISNSQKISEICKAYKADGKKIVFTNGCFDLLHSGHSDYLIEAKKKGDILIVGLNSDASIKRLKGENRPIVDQNSRLKLLSSLQSVDYCVLFEEDDPRELISIIKPDIHIKGSDYRNKEMIERSTVEQHGGQVEFVDLSTVNENKISTTDIIKRIKNEY